MSTYDLNRMIEMWGLEKLTAEQAIGQIMLHLRSLSKRVGDIEKNMYVWQRQEKRNQEAKDATMSKDDATV